MSPYTCGGGGVWGGVRRRHARHRSTHEGRIKTKQRRGGAVGPRGASRGGGGGVVLLKRLGGGGPGTQKSKSLCTKKSQINNSFCKALERRGLLSKTLGDGGPIEQKEPKTVAPISGWMALMTGALWNVPFHSLGTLHGCYQLLEDSVHQQHTP